MKEHFRKFSQKVAFAMGTPYAFTAACTLVVIWALCGPMMKFSDSWELIINTATTIITFLMVFIIQNTQNRDMKTLQLKLDELIHATKKARNMMVDLESLTERELDDLEKEFIAIRNEKDEEDEIRQTVKAE